MPGWSFSMTATSGSRPCPVDGSTSGSSSDPRGGRRWSRDGAPALAAGSSPRSDRRKMIPPRGAPASRVDRVAGAWPLGHRVTRRAGPGWLLVGDAAGFLDPFTGEGLHRALVSTELAAAAIEARGRRSASARCAFDAYDRAMQRRFLAKDAVSWLVQSFLGQPARLRVRSASRRHTRRRPCDDGPCHG